MLKEKTLEELFAICEELGIKAHHASKEASLIKKIEAQQGHRVEDAVSKADDLKHKAEQPVVSEANTQEAVENIIEPFIDRGLKAKFLDDGTWMFRCNGAEDSGSMTMPLRLIRNKAEQVSRGRRALPSLGREKSDRTYAGNIISA